MYLMLDIVVNHVGFAGEPASVDYSVFNPFNDQQYFHNYCQVNDPTNLTNTEVCWLGDSSVPLVDLRTEDQDVQAMFGKWISEMVSNYSIDGLRIDTAINVDPAFFPDFVQAAGVFATGETMQGDTSVVCQWADAIGSILNYPIYFTLTRAFQSAQGSINDLVETISSVKTNCKDPTALGTFSENHDVPRFASYTPDIALAENIITYTLMSDGIPIIYQGQEQHMNGTISPYTNRAPLWSTGYNTTAPLYEHIATLNLLRKHVLQASTNYTNYMTEVIYQDYHTIGMRKGFNGSQVVTVLNNNGNTTADFMLGVNGHDFPPGTQLMEVLSCTNLTVDSAGSIDLPMGKGKSKIMYPTSLLYNSSLCGMPDQAPLSISKTVTVAYTTTMSGHKTIVHTPTVVPATTMSPGVAISAASAPTPMHSRLALGAGTHLDAGTSGLLAAVLALVASAGLFA